MPSPLSVTAAYVRVGEEMGQQIVDQQLMTALEERDDLSVSRLAVGPFRSGAKINKRLPMGPLNRAPFAAKRAVGAAIYPIGPVHRFDLRLPPARREVVTVHDVVQLRFDDEGLPARHVGEGLRRALAVVCPSRFSADEVRAAYGVERVHVVPNGLDPAFLLSEPLPSSAREQLGVAGRFVLHAGGATRRKNLIELAGAWPAVRAAHPDIVLALCGPTDPRRTELFAQLPGTLLLGKLPRRLLIGLMASASVVVVPSVYEGFGLPAAEALACGVSVVAARRASLPEVLQEHGLLVEPDAEGLAAGLHEALAQPLSTVQAAAGRRAAARRTWSASAQAYADIYHAVFQ